MSDVTLTTEQLSIILGISKDVQIRIKANGMPELDEDLAEMIELLEAAIPPTIEGLNPDTAVVPGPDQLVVVHGVGFTPESIIVWNDQDVATVFEKENKVNTTVSMTAAGVDPVYVRNGTVKSNIVEFTFTGEEPAGRRKRR